MTPDNDLSNPTPPQERPETLHGLDPGELLARALDTVRPSGGASAWEPPLPEELGRIIQTFVNGRQVTDAFDRRKLAPKSGVFALALGAQSLAQFKELKIRNLQSNEERERREAAVRWSTATMATSPSERVALENVMVSSKWSWRYHSLPIENAIEVTFGGDGIAHSPHFNCPWKVCGPFSVLIYPHNQPVLLSIDRSLARFEGELAGGDFRYSGERIPTPNQPSVPAPTPTPPPAKIAESEALVKALLAHTWVWKSIVPEQTPWKEIVFLKDGTMTTSTTTTAWWKVFGSHSVTLEFGSERMSLLFNSEMDRFTGWRDAGELVASGWIVPSQGTSSTNTATAAPQTAAGAAARSPASQGAEAGLIRGRATSLFNGTDLTGWSGLLGYWSVENRAITGKITAGTLSRGNTFLVWQGGEPSDFEFNCKYRLIANNPEGMANSGIQFRARYSDPARYELKGYQGEMDPGTSHPNDWVPMPNTNGCLIDDPPGTLLAPTGQRVTIHPGQKTTRFGNFDAIGSLGTAQPSANLFRKGDWNDYRIVALGNRIQIFVNGLQTVDATDEGNRFDSGLIGLQLDDLSRQKIVQFKDIELRELHGHLPVAMMPNAVTTPLPPPPPATATVQNAVATRGLVPAIATSAGKVVRRENLPHPVAGAGPTRLEDALFSYKWSWVNDVINFHAVLEFQKDGTIRHTEGHDPWRWKRNGPRTILVEHGRKFAMRFVLDFNESFSAFASTSNAERPISGVRLEPLVSSAAVHSALEAQEPRDPSAINPSPTSLSPQPDTAGEPQVVVTGVGPSGTNFGSEASHLPLHALVSTNSPKPVSLNVSCYWIVLNGGHHSIIPVAASYNSQISCPPGEKIHIDLDDDVSFRRNNGASGGISNPAGVFRG